MSIPFYSAINSGYFLFGSSEDSIYNILSFLEPGVMVDVGAAMGDTTKKMLAANPTSQVFAFEPFPGNRAFMLKEFENDSRVKFIEKAAADKTTGFVNFYVPKVVEGNENGWKDHLGYSSVGYIVEDTVHSSNIYKVPVTSISVEVNEHIRFCKIDVQGKEADVLRGCHSLIRDHGIDFMLIEFSGQSEVLSFLHARDYIIFDTRYMLVLKKDMVIPSKDWIIEGSANLSTGDKAFFGWPVNRPLELFSYCEMIRKTQSELGYIQTDIVAVHKSFMSKFLQAAGQLDL